MAEILLLISQIAFVVAGASFLIAVFFWFKFDVLQIISDLSGRTARKSVAKLREVNEKNGSKSYRPSATNVARGKLTDTMSDMGNSKKKEKSKTSRNDRPETGLLSENKAGVIDSPKTELLVNEITDINEQDDEDTVSLAVKSEPSVKRSGGKKLTMLDEIIMIHTKEVI